jgi:hypothetical protein
VKLGGNEEGVNTDGGAVIGADVTGATGGALKDGDDKMLGIAGKVAVEFTGGVVRGPTGLVVTGD